jgi:hypothetical protein
MGQPDIAVRHYQRVLHVAGDNVEARIGLAEALTALGDRGEPDRYEHAEREFARGIALAYRAGVPQLDERTGSNPLASHGLAAAHYARGYALVRLHESESSRVPFPRGGRSYLEEALHQFREARTIDPTHSQATSAIECLEAERRRARSRGWLQQWIPIALVGLCLLLLVAANVFFIDQQLGANVYAALVFGLLLFMIAALSLPQLLKLKVGGIALEKTVVEQGVLAAGLGVPRDASFASLPAFRLTAQRDVQLRPPGQLERPDPPDVREQLERRRPKRNDPRLAGQQTAVGAELPKRQSPTNGANGSQS